MDKVIAALNAAWRAAEEFNALATDYASSKRAKKIGLEESRLLRKKALSAEVMISSGEIALFSLPVEQPKKTITKAK